MKFTEFEQTQIEKLLQDVKIVKDIENTECRTALCYFLEDKFENEEEKIDFYIKVLEYAEIYDLEEEMKVFLRNGRFNVKKLCCRNNLIVSKYFTNYDLNNTVGFLTFLDSVYVDKGKYKDKDLYENIKNKLKDAVAENFFNALTISYLNTDINHCDGNIYFSLRVNDNVNLSRDEALSLLRVLNNIDYINRDYHIINIKKIDYIPEIKLIFSEGNFRNLKRLIKETLKEK